MFFCLVGFYCFFGGVFACLKFWGGCWFDLDLGCFGWLGWVLGHTHPAMPRVYSWQCQGSNPGQMCAIQIA